MPEQIVAKLREGEKLQGQGYTIPQLVSGRGSRRRSIGGG